MRNPKTDAKGYRDRAEELRVIAADVMQKETRDVLLRLAASYEKMALHATEITAHVGAINEVNKSLDEQGCDNQPLDDFRTTMQPK